MWLSDRKPLISCDYNMIAIFKKCNANVEKLFCDRNNGDIPFHHNNNRYPKLADGNMLSFSHFCKA